mmetsp:Transcript_73687/g.159458  ORF Transcript_73687/g.159458 Transcript_73687/m.159458 type:complete len:259 (-) Transcript_73687:64-840(-)
MDALHIGMRLHASHSDGEYYAAEVVALKRGRVQVRFVGHGETAWCTKKQLRSRALKGSRAREQVAPAEQRRAEYLQAQGGQAATAGPQVEQSQAPSAAAAQRSAEHPAQRRATRRQIQAHRLALTEQQRAAQRCTLQQHPKQTKDWRLPWETLEEQVKAQQQAEQQHAAQRLAEKQRAAQCLAEQQRARSEQQLAAQRQVEAQRLAADRQEWLDDFEFHDALESMREQYPSESDSELWDRLHGQMQEDAEEFGGCSSD